MGVIVPIRHAVKPQYPAPINWLAPITNELVAVYKCDNQGRLIDSARGHHGTYSGNPTIVGSKFGKGLDFDGAGDSATISDHADLNFGTNDDITIVVLTKPGATSQDSELLEKQSGNPLYQIIATGLNTWRFVIRDTGGSLIFAEATTVQILNQWQHLAGRRKYGDVIDISVNGMQEDSTSDTVGSITNTTDLLIATGNSGDYNGVINYIYIWRRYLKDAELRSLYHFPNQIFMPIVQRVNVPVAAVGGRIMSSLTNHGGLAGRGGIAGVGGGLAG